MICNRCDFEIVALTRAQARRKGWEIEVHQFEGGSDLWICPACQREIREEGMSAEYVDWGQV